MNPATGVDIWAAVIPAALALVVLIVLGIFGKKKKK
jgi:LPXTG-motif cell wall-anchored protein